MDRTTVHATLPIKRTSAGPRAQVSAAFEFADAADGGTHLRLTEQGAYLDGFDGPKFWQSGTSSLPDRLRRSLE